MGTARRHAQLLWCAATDRTFERAELKGVEVLAGKCIHCNCVVCVALTGGRVLRATVEHIVPRTHGGSDTLENLAIACGRCNGAKGVRHDSSPWGDPKLMAMIERLLERKRKRMREPLAGLTLPVLDEAAGAGDAEEGVEEEALPRRKRRGG